MITEKKIVEIKDEELSNVTGGTDEFPEADDLQLTPKEKKELKK